MRRELNMTVGRRRIVLCSLLRRWVPLGFRQRQDSAIPDGPSTVIVQLAGGKGHRGSIGSKHQGSI
jgi:hypothetical protein